MNNFQTFLKYSSKDRKEAIIHTLCKPESAAKPNSTNKPAESEIGKHYEQHATKIPNATFLASSIYHSQRSRVKLFASGTRPTKLAGN